MDTTTLGRSKGMTSIAAFAACILCLCTPAAAEVTGISSIGTLAAGSNVSVSGPPQTLDGPQTIDLSNDTTFLFQTVLSSNNVTGTLGDTGAGAGSAGVTYAFDPVSNVLTGSGSAAESTSSSCVVAFGNEVCGSGNGSAGVAIRVFLYLTTSYTYIFSSSANRGSAGFGFVLLQDAGNNVLPASGTMTAGLYSIVGNAVGNAASPGATSSDSQAFSFTLSLSPPSNYTISISGLKAINPGAALPLRAIVSDSTGKPVAGATVHLKIAAIPGSGGHQHGADTDENRTGTINGDAQHYVAPTPTDATGTFAFNFNAPIVSGTYTIAASCDDRVCAQQGLNAVDVKIDGLMLLRGPGQYYDLIGNTPVHPDNHYFSPAAKVNALILAYSYHKLFPKNPLIKFNDSTLPWGGAFDITYDGNSQDLCSTGPNCNWGPPHSQHRFGTVVDIRRGADGVPEGSVGNFENLVTKQLKMAIVPEGNPSHFHVCLLGPTSCQ